MEQDEMVSQYNYDAFVPEKFTRWMNFEASPPIGKPASDYPLWHLDERESRLSNIWSKNLLTVFEFGSFT